MFVYVRQYPVIGPFLSEQFTSLHDTIIDTASTDNNLTVPTDELGTIYESPLVYIT